MQRNSPCVSFVWMGKRNVYAQMASLREVLSSRPKPGWHAQALACPPGRPKDHAARIRDARRAGVVSLLCWHEDEWQVLLMVRTRDNTPHSSQVAFPGGAAEGLDGGDLTKTALRELEEEVGLSLDHGQIMGGLSPIYIPPSHFFVQPIVACCLGVPDLRLQEEEVAEVMFVPLSGLPGAGAVWPNQKVQVRGAEVTVPGWPVGGHVLWGATAMMMAELLVVCEAAGFGLSFAPPKPQES